MASDSPVHLVIDAPTSGRGAIWSMLGGTRPELTCHRHPLQELTVPTYVANDTFLLGGEEAGDQPSMLMMTGPNFSGKSVHLKHVALIVYMAHVGCFVPADAATIGLTDKILTRVATKETITKAQSAFMIDLQQVTKALSLATHRSLVIVDEFGKGTDSNGTLSLQYT